MKILPIDNAKINNKNLNLSETSRQRQASPVFTATQPSLVLKSHYGSALVFMSQTEKLKNETQKFPQDIEYRKSVLKNAGLPSSNQHRIRAIIGPDEIGSVLKDFNDNEQFYSVGKDDENILNHKMRANLHIHTTASDGEMTVKELLDKAAEYADSVAKNNPNAKNAPFVIGITDHDTTEGAKEAIKTVYENPLKYRNLRVILGVEMTTFNNILPDVVGEPTNTHVLIYGVDPYEKNFNGFIDGIKTKKGAVAEKMIETANSVYSEHFNEENFFNIAQAREEYNPLSKNILGIYNNVDCYIRNKFAVKHVILQDTKITAALQENHIPTDADGFMAKLSEYHEGLDKKNKVLPPEKTLPEFISESTGLDKGEIAERLTIGLKDKEGAYSALSKSLEPYKITLRQKQDYMPAFSDLLEGTKSQKGVLMGLAHPIDYTKMAKDENSKYSFLGELYSRFKAECKEKARFSEVYYQSYKPCRKEFKENWKTKYFMNGVSKVYSLLKTGSADSHGLSIFKRL